MNKVLFFFFCLIVQTGFSQRVVPPLWSHSVHDEAHVLSASAIDALEVILKQHEDSTSNQIAVLIIPSLDGEVLEAFSFRVAHDEWKLGQEGKDNGVLLLIAVEDRKMRIEVGEGLEGVLPDAIASRIIRNEIAPHFRSQNYEQGVTAGVEAIIRAIGGEYTQDQEASGLGDISAELSWKEKLLIGAFVFGILGIFTFLGLVIPGCGGWALYAFLIPFYATFPMAILGVDGGLYALGTYLISFPLLKFILGKTAWGKVMSKKMGTTRSGSGTSSGWSGGRSSGGWSSGGGFSGGGGSFGGGGSSGSW